MWVFVYGTLRSGESNHHVIQEDIVELEPGKVAGVLHDAGHFPYLVTGDSGCGYVTGDWLRIENDTALVKLDSLEGFKEAGYEFNHYDRVVLKDVNSGRTGWVYIAGPRIRTEIYSVISSGDWKVR
ncbi:gamma-glutamylcyclotransferase [Alicyclobacillus sp. SO9]|uniref:gamma-glutamylcyclotransferase family protein n=1 Tax=Alicyclobacillus sp. SO9 TaxID=2665646 RepID=UPI0019356F27|nr:gamma-glutamylcyclotransferase family protein [Alicyclobacillus sp. SO9]QQE79655.1 gamma-glutamylcyclotransferase [Alicyclobacillus sp. SO9]